MTSHVQKKVDVLVIGGGINGAGIARDLAGRGLSVMLCEKNDLASATSSASTKLVHGGLRYLEYFKFGLVRAALKEREVLMKMAPHIIWPLTFILPHHKDLRPRWLIRLGLFLYDHLGGRKILSGARGHNLTGTILGQPLKSNFRYGFSYADCWVEDTRLVVLNALSAAENGAEIYTRVEALKIEKHPNEKAWLVLLRDNINGAAFHVHAEMIVNASGPWVARTLDLAQDITAKYGIRWVKGSHIIVPKLYQGEQAYILQNGDGRIVFLIPYEREFTLIGTTDVDYQGDIDEVRVDFEEVDYLCAAASEYLRSPIQPEDVLWTYSGVRPLLDDGKKSAASVTRDYVLDMAVLEGASILSVYGGKITTYRKLSEQAANKVVDALGRGGKSWTAGSSLPGAELVADFGAFYKTFKREFNWLPKEMLERIAHSYGTRARDLLRGFKRLSDMGEHLGDHVYEAEIRYLISTEWAMTAEDILWRRSKLGLHVTEKTEKKIRKLIKKIYGVPEQQQESA